MELRNLGQILLVLEVWQEFNSFYYLIQRHSIFILPLFANQCSMVIGFMTQVKDFDE